MKKRHIDVISKYFSPANAGIEVNITQTYKILAQLGWDITIHTSRNTLTENDVLSPTDEILGMHVTRYKFRRIFGFFPRLNWESTDLVCFHNFNVFFVFILLYIDFLKLIGRKRFSVVITPHGGFNPEWSIYSKLMVMIKKTYHYTLGTFLINLVVDKVRAVSEWERHEIISKGIKEEKVVTISNGLEDEAYQDVDKLASPEIKQKVKSYHRYIIQIGRVYPIKNYETTIRTLPQIPSDVKYIIVGGVEGNGNYLTNLKKLISELKLENRVVFFGIARGIDKYYLIKHAQIMVHMAIWESFCNVVHEGLSQGLVCIVANAYALPYLIKDNVNGYLVNTFDNKTLSTKINYVLKNIGLKEILAMKKRNREFGLQDSWRSVAGRMNLLYRSLLIKP